MWWWERKAACVVVVLWWLLAADLVRGQISADGLRRLQQATVLIESGADRCSGVLISETGLIATAAHGVHGAVVRVRLADGQVRMATVAGRDEPGDTALLRLQRDADSDKLVCVPLGDSGDELTAGMSVFAAGFPARELRGNLAVLRAGVVKSAAAGVLRTTCQLTVGDSGGPLLDGEGRLVGMHRQIGAGVASNLHSTPAALRRLLQQASVTSAELPALTTAVAIADVLQAGGPKEEQVRPHLSSLLQVVPATEAELAGSEHLWGWLVTDRLLALQMSAADPGTVYAVRSGNAGPLRLKLKQQSYLLDLAIYELVEGQLGDGVRPLVWRDQPVRLFEQVHSVSCKAGVDASEVSAAGVVSRIDWNEPPVRPVLGAEAEEMNSSAGRRLRVIQTVPNSAAAGQLQAGDILAGADGVVLTSRRQFAELLGRRQPGDLLRLDVLRGEQLRRLTLRLGWNPGEQFEKSEYLDGRSGPVSERRTGFVGVLQHDIPVDPSACPQLLVDWQGLPVGLTISRRAREATLAIPAIAVQQLVRGKE